MSRIPLLSVRESGWLARSISFVTRRRLGKASSAPRLIGHNKKVLFAWAMFMGCLDRWNALPRRIKRLMHLRVAMRVGCPA